MKECTASCQNCMASFYVSMKAVHSTCTGRIVHFVQRKKIIQNMTTVTGNEITGNESTDDIGITLSSFPTPVGFLSRWRKILVQSRCS